MIISINFNNSSKCGVFLRVIKGSLKICPTLYCLFADLSIRQCLNMYMVQQHDVTFEQKKTL